MSQPLVVNATVTAVRHLALGTVDYVVIVIMLLISSGIGIYFRFSGGKQSTTNEFLMAGRDMAVLPVAFSVMASGKSAITYLGIASEMYIFGTHYAFVNLGTSVGALVAGYLFLPVFFKTGSCTTYEYLEKRYGRVLRMFCSLTFSIQSMLYIGVILYAPALALSAVTDLSIWTCVIAVGFVCTFYCTLGGMKAVLWTDVFQATLMYGGLIAMVIKGCLDVGGVDTVIERAKEGGRLLVPQFEMDLTTRYTFINVFLNGFFIALSAYGASQMQVQRLLTVRSVQRARCALFTNIPMTFLFHSVNCFAGLVIYANFFKCDPLTSGENIITKPDQLLPYFSLTTLGHIPGLPGLCVCGMLSAALSTMSSIVNSLTTVTVEDFIRPTFALRGITEGRATFIAKIITLVYGFTGLLLTYIVANFGNVLQASSIVYGLVAGPTLGVFLLGVLTSRTNERGAIFGLVLSLCLTAWISFGGASTNVAHPILPMSTKGCPGNHSLTIMKSLPYNETGFTSLSHTTSIADFVTEKTTTGDADKLLYRVTIHCYTFLLAFLDLRKAVIFTLQASIFSMPWVTSNLRFIFPLYRISYMWFTPIGVFTTVIFGYIGSLLFGKSPDSDICLLSPIVTKLKIVKKPEKCNGVEMVSVYKQKDEANVT